MLIFSLLNNPNWWVWRETLVIGYIYYRSRSKFFLKFSLKYRNKKFFFNFVIIQKIYTIWFLQNSFFIILFKGCLMIFLLRYLDIDTLGIWMTSLQLLQYFLDIDKSKQITLNYWNWYSNTRKVSCILFLRTNVLLHGWWYTIKLRL